MSYRTTALSVAAFAALAFSGSASAVTVNFTGAVATFSQSGFGVASAIDGSTASGSGWAISRESGNPLTDTQSETALFTINPVTGGPTDFTFTLTQNFGNFHSLGNFSLAYATGAGPTLASTQNAFTITSAISLSGALLTFTGGKVSASGLLQVGDTYIITAHANAAGPFTGIFLNAINDSAYDPLTGGPGRQPINGNFVLNEITGSAVPGVAGVPEPAGWALMLGGFGMIGGAMRRRAAIKQVRA